MEIKTKFNPGQRVYLLYDNKVEQDLIITLNVTLGSKHLTPVICYYLENCGMRREKDLFATKQELIDSL